jgi:hypothetical protein
VRLFADDSFTFPAATVVTLLTQGGGGSHTVILSD